MKKVGLFAIMVACASSLGIGQIALKKECNLPRAGDKYEKQQVEHIHPGDSGENVIWHFNDINKNKSVLKDYLNNNRYFYNSIQSPGTKTVI